LETPMRYFWRELIGWALVALGVVIFLWAALLLTLYHGVFEAGPMTIAGIFVFRGGIHLLKVAVAARVCTEAAAEIGKRDKL
jgi:hypothetical protein